MQALSEAPLEPPALRVSSLLRADGVLLLLTGNADEAAERGPERLTRADLERCFATRGLVCEACDAFRFDATAAYERQPQAEPPLGWCSVWRKTGEGATTPSERMAAQEKLSVGM